jgi:hypothetical protein
MRQLFIDHKNKEQVKSAAAAVSLPEDPNSWPSEILQELFKQVPYVSSYDPDVVMDRTDAEQGYGFGHILLKNKTEIPASADPTAQAQAGIKMVRIPIIISEGKLSPFDTLITTDSQMYPLTATRLRKALFRPQMFDVSARSPGDTSIIGQLFPPYRQNYGVGGGIASSMGMGKAGSADLAEHKPELADRLSEVLSLPPEVTQKLKDRKNKQLQPKLAAAGVPNSTVTGRMGKSLRQLVSTTIKTGSVLNDIQHTLRPGDLSKFASAFGDRETRFLYDSNSVAALPIASFILNVPVMTQDKVASSFNARITPDVVQIHRESVDRYSVKTANHAAWAPVSYEIGRKELIEKWGQKIAKEVDLSSSGTVTITNGPEAQGAVSVATLYEVVSKPGMYKVRTEPDNRELVGFVFPNLVDLDGTLVPTALFTNGSESAYQSAIVGEAVSDAKNPMTRAPEAGDYGVFVHTDAKGELHATEPLHYKAGLKAKGEFSHLVLDDDGIEYRVRIDANSKFVKPTCVGETESILPGVWHWMPVGDQKPVALIENTHTLQKTGEANVAPYLITVRSDGRYVSLEGNALDKVAQEDKTNISLDDAMFLMGGLGLHLNYAAEKIAESAYTQGPVKARVGRSIKLASDLKSAISKEASSFLPYTNALQRYVVKEAAYIPDPASLDVILSLGFINPENIATFISYLPELDKTQSKLCELLLASRLGLRDIPVSSLEKVTKSLEEVIDGLNTLAFQEGPDPLS